MFYYFFRYTFIFICLSIFSHAYLPTMYVYFLERLEGSIGSPGNGAMYVCKQQCGFLKSSPSSLEEKQVTLAANPSVHSPDI